MAGAADLQALRSKIDGYLREMVPNLSVDDEGDFMVRLGDAITWVRAAAWEGGRSLVRVWSITNVGMRVDEELTRYLVTTNAQLAMGGFRLDESGPAVMIVHSLLGDYLNRAELQAAVAVVTGMAVDFGPQIKSRFGGQLFSES